MSTTSSVLTCKLDRPKPFEWVYTGDNKVYRSLTFCMDKANEFPKIPSKLPTTLPIYGSKELTTTKPFISYPLYKKPYGKFYFYSALDTGSTPESQLSYTENKFTENLKTYIAQNTGKYVVDRNNPKKLLPNTTPYLLKVSDIWEPFNYMNYFYIKKNVVSVASDFTTPSPIITEFFTQFIESLTLLFNITNAFFGIGSITNLKNICDFSSMSNLRETLTTLKMTYYILTNEKQFVNLFFPNFPPLDDYRMNALFTYIYNNYSKGLKENFSYRLQNKQPQWHIGVL